MSMMQAGCCCGGCTCAHCVAITAPTAVLVSFTISGAPSCFDGLIKPGPGGSTYTCGPDPLNPGNCLQGVETSTGLYPISGSVVANVCPCETAYRTDGAVFVANAVEFYSGSSSYSKCQNYGAGPCCTVDYDFSLYATVVLHPTVETSSRCSFRGGIEIASSTVCSSEDCTEEGIVCDPCDYRTYATCAVPGGFAAEWEKPTIAGACDPREASWTLEAGGSSTYVTEFSVS